MTKKSSKFLNIWITVFMYIFLIVILGTGASNIDYNIPSAFSQGNNPPAGITTFTECPQIAFSGPTYTGPDGCPRPCPTNNSGFLAGTIPPGCPLPSGTNQNSSQNPSHFCPQIAFSGPTYTGPNGCEQPCPTNPINAPPGCSQQHSLTLNKSLHEKTKHNR